MKIGIMGGTFDPIHNGHLMLGDYACRQFRLQRIWVMPNGNPPHKSQETASEHRIRMAALAIENDPRFELNLYEAERPEVSYSYETIQNLSELYPEHDFYFILGADSLFTIESWRRPDSLLSDCTILAACRDDKDIPQMMEQIDYLKKKYYARIELLSSPMMDVSSSDIRRMVQYGMDVSHLVPPGVEEYIREHRLYLTKRPLREDKEG